MEPIAFDLIIERWAERLLEQIELYQAVGKTVCLVALSRKMPRFLEWLFKEEPFESARELKRIVDSGEVELITEYAIPLINFKKEDSSAQNLAGIIVDDALIYGSTANRVCMEWIAASGEYPTISTPFRSSEACIPDVFESPASRLAITLPFDDLKKALRLISEKIAKTALPVDMEYPIIKVAVPYESVKAHVISSIPSDWRYYDVESSLYNEFVKPSFSIIIPDSFQSSESHDFVKFRIFDKGPETLIEIIAPQTINLQSLAEDGSLFNESVYRSIYEEIVTAIVAPDRDETADERIPHDIMSSAYRYLTHRKIQLLVVWINYLQSLSTFIDIYNRLVPDGAEAEISVEDIKLIIGKELAYEVMPGLNLIIRERICNRINSRRVALPTYVNPDDMREKYMTLVLNNIRPDNTIEENLERIFAASHYTTGLSREAAEMDRFGHSHFGETYESLVSFLNDYHYEDPDLLLRINRWIDMSIDECRVAPKYEFVRGSDGYWHSRRFFLCGSNC